MWWWCYYIFSGACCVMFQLISFIPIVLVKSFAVPFSLQRERLKSLNLVPRGIGLGEEPWDQLLVNWFTHWGCHILRLAKCDLCRRTQLSISFPNLLKQHFVSLHILCQNQTKATFKVKMEIRSMKLREAYKAALPWPTMGATPSTLSCKTRKPFISYKGLVNLKFSYDHL